GLVTVVKHPAMAPSRVADSVWVLAAYVTTPGEIGCPSRRAWTWMATLAVETSFLLFRLETSVCVNRPASTDALTYSSLLAGVLTGEARIVTQSPVPLVCLIKAKFDVENANLADGSAWPVWTASGRAITTATRNAMDNFFMSLIAVVAPVGFSGLA